MQSIQIPMSASAGNKHIVTEYTGTNGLYSSVLPDLAAITAIQAVATTLGIELDSSTIHCTVCYSKIAADWREIPSYPATREFTAICNQVDHWVGHNNKTYVVLKLMSPDIVLMNAEIQRSGAKHTFVPFQPHVSLSDSTTVDLELQAKIDEVNSKLAYEPLVLRFNSLTIGDQDQ